MPPADDIAFSTAVGPQRAELLAKLGLRTRRDLLFHVPARYEDRTQFTPLSLAAEGEAITLHGTIVSAKASRWRGGRTVFEIAVRPQGATDPGEVLRAMWFNVHYLQKVLVKDVELLLFGKVKQGKKGWAMVHPEFELVERDGEEYIHLSRITPVYPLTEGLSQRVLRRILFFASQRTPIEVDDLYPVPPDLLPWPQALAEVHFPTSWEQMQAARRRLIYDEFFLQQCILVRRRLGRERVVKERAAATSALAEAFLAALPFQPTGAQSRAMAEVARDMAIPAPMNRLLQGDVGSGKTLVAVHAMLGAVERGEQAALMAPTEILAEQHYLNLKRWLDPLGVSVGLHTGSRKKTDRSPLDDGPVLDGLFGGKGAITVGTHALIHDAFAVERLGLVVVDEQHKFGVMQRLALTRKGRHPDVLVMTATPIPRTLAMTVYGDLDVSTLDELPPGRGAIVTACRAEADLPKVWAFLRKEVAAGRQAFIVYPLIDESEKIEAKAVQREFERLSLEFRPARTGLLHGRLKPAEKEAVMAAFRANEIQVLVSTPVIEVGVDVPNATLMVIENAERFGLAQLHQLRGRIGRGAGKSYCVLVGEPKSQDSWRRLKIMEQTLDGFKIAEEDLRIRGPGDILGTDQSGLPPLRFGDPLRDWEMLQRARTDADRIIRADPTLRKHPRLRDALQENGGWRQTLAAVG